MFNFKKNNIKGIFKKPTYEDSHHFEILHESNFDSERDGVLIIIRGLEFKEFLKNPIVMYEGHSWSTEIGYVENITKIENESGDNYLRVSIKFYNSSEVLENSIIDSIRNNPSEYLLFPEIKRLNQTTAIKSKRNEELMTIVHGSKMEGLKFIHTGETKKYRLEEYISKLKPFPKGNGSDYVLKFSIFKTFSYYNIYDIRYEITEKLEVLYDYESIGFLEEIHPSVEVNYDIPKEDYHLYHHLFINGNALDSITNTIKRENKNANRKN